MPLYELGTDGQLLPFRRLAGAELYETELEELFWNSPDEFLGEALFPVRRQAQLPHGGKPDIIALDRDARVVVVEVKRDVERQQLAQCLEYAGWARSASLDDLATMYHAGPGQFFADWQDFTESSTPTVINPSPRLVLLARTFHGRTGAALAFLVENKLPVHVIETTVYEDVSGRRFIDVTGDHEPEVPAGGLAVDEGVAQAAYKIKLPDLLEHGLLIPGDSLTWHRPKLGESYAASVTEAGLLRLPDGRTFSTPSGAAIQAANIAAYDGWHAWKVERLDGKPLHELREQLAAKLAAVGSDA